MRLVQEKASKPLIDGVGCSSGCGGCLCIIIILVILLLLVAKGCMNSCSRLLSGSNDRNEIISTTVSSTTTTAETTRRETIATDGTKQTTAETTNETTKSDTVNPELKALLDQYEEIMNDYIDFMEDYSADPMSSIYMSDKYLELLDDYYDAIALLEQIDSSSLSGADLEYYLEVTGRVSQRLMSVAI